MAGVRSFSNKETTRVLFQRFKSPVTLESKRKFTLTPFLTQKGKFQKFLFKQMAVELCNSFSRVELKEKCHA